MIIRARVVRDSMNQKFWCPEALNNADLDDMKSSGGYKLCKRGRPEVSPLRREEAAEAGVAELVLSLVLVEQT